MQKKAARLCCAILLMAVAIAASMGLMSAVFAAQSLRTPDIQAAEAPTEAPLMHHSGRGRAGAAAPHPRPGRQRRQRAAGAGPLPRRDDAGRGRLYPSAERIRPRGIRPVLVRRRAAPSDGRSGRLRARAAVARRRGAGLSGIHADGQRGLRAPRRRLPRRGRKRPLQPVRRAARHNIRPAGKRRPARHRHADGGRAGAARPARALRTLSNCQILLAGSD